jgi:hypothetical protein
MPFTFGSPRMILKAAVTWSFEAPPPTSRKLAGVAAVVLDDVHRAHGEAGAVDQAADVAVERDVVEASTCEASISFGSSSSRSRERRRSRMAEEGVVVERHLGVEREHLAGRAW